MITDMARIGPKEDPKDYQQRRIKEFNKERGIKQEPESKDSVREKPPVTRSQTAAKKQEQRRQKNLEEFKKRIKDIFKKKEEEESQGRLQRSNSNPLTTPLKF